MFPVASDAGRTEFVRVLRSRFKAPLDACVGFASVLGNGACVIPAARAELIAGRRSPVAKESWVCARLAAREALSRSIGRSTTRSGGLLAVKLGRSKCDRKLVVADAAGRSAGTSRGVFVTLTTGCSHLRIVSHWDKSVRAMGARLAGMSNSVCPSSRHLT